MDIKIRHIIKFTATALLAILLYGCTNVEDYLNRGIDHYDAGRYEKAALEFKNVLKIDNINIDARYRLALTEEKLGHWKSALFHYREIIQSDISHVMARVKLAELYVSAKVPDTVLKLADEIEVADPGNPTVLVLRAKAYALNNDLKLATEFAQSAFDAEQKKSPSTALLLAAFHSQQSENEKSISVLKESINHNPTDLQLQLMLANFYINQGDTRVAKALLEKINKSSSEKAAYRISLAQLYIRLDMLDEAEYILRASVTSFSDLSAKIALIEFLANKRTLDSAKDELQGFIKELPDKHQLRFILAKLYELNGQADKAGSEYRKIISIDKLVTDGLKAKRKLALLLVKTGDKDSAKKLIDEVLTQEPLDHEARLIRATIYIADENLELSIAEINRILKRTPDWVPALRLLARIHLNNKKPQQAEEILQRIVNANPKDIDSQLNLAAFLEAQGNTTGAIQQLETAWQHTSNNPQVLEAMIKLQTKVKAWDNAKKNIEQYKDAYSESPKGYYLAGLMYEAMGDMKTSRKEFEMSLQLQPAAKEPLAALIKGYILEDKGNLAIVRIQKVIKNHPSSAFAYQLLGETQWSEKRFKEAEGAFRNALELQPKWSLPYVRLGDMLLQQNKSKDAISVYQQGINKSSGSITVHLKLCMAYEQLKQFDLAIQEYEELLRRRPKSMVAANNLAMLLITHGVDAKSLNRALKVSKLLTDSKNPIFMDTVGWVHYKSGDFNKAAMVLADAVEKAPEVQEFRYHLGMAYYKKGHVNLARHHLKMALKGKPNFNGVKEARATLPTL